MTAATEKQSYRYIKNRLTLQVMRIPVEHRGLAEDQYSLPGAPFPVDRNQLSDGGWDLLGDDEVLRWALEQYGNTENWATIGRKNQKLIKWIDSDTGNSLAVQVLNDVYPIEGGAA
ncbi:MAG: hypothetical protein AAFU78_14915 [Cyanobacteria bacterium J06633_2]